MLIWRCVLILTLLPTCWLGMQIVHETGHVIAGALLGGSVDLVVLHPLTISRTDVTGDSLPIVTCWSGPILGVTLPLLVSLVWSRWKLTGWKPVQFFAGFCLISNGLYIGIGSFDRVGDAGDAQRLGSPIWVLWAFGLLVVPSGFWLWHRLGPKFGMEDETIGGRDCCVSVVVLAVIVASEWLCSRL